MDGPRADRAVAGAAPDIPIGSAVVGLRYWSLTADATALTSVSHRRFRWPADGPLRATCVAGRHRAPAPGCGCGIYAATDLDALTRHGLCLAPTGLVVGEVEMWGRVIAEDGGWRAELARPRSLAVVVETVPGRADEVAGALGAYGVAVGRAALADVVNDLTAAQMAFEAMARGSN